MQRIHPACSPLWRPRVWAVFAVPVLLLVWIPVAAAGHATRDVTAVCPAWMPSALAATPATATAQPQTTAANDLSPAGPAAVGSSNATVVVSPTENANVSALAIEYWVLGSPPACGSVQKTQSGDLTGALSGLQPATRYRFRFVVKAAGGAVFGKTGMFVTLAAGRIAEGVTVGGVRIGHLDRADALETLNRSVGKPLRLAYAGAQWQVLPSSLGAHVNISQAVSDALQAAPNEQLPALDVSVDAAPLKHYVSSLSRRWGHQSSQGSVSLVGTHAVVMAARPAVAIDTAHLQDAIRAELVKGTRALVTLPVKLDPAAVATPVKSVVVRRSTQTLTAYLNGKPVLTTPVTTGRPALPTPIGSFSVQFRESPYTFHSPWPPGSPYWYPPTPVTWAMEFYDGDFLHDDPGEPSSAFGSDSDTGYFASHGCVHVPHDVMAFLYNWLPVGAPVIIAQT